MVYRNVTPLDYDSEDDNLVWKDYQHNRSPSCTEEGCPMTRYTQPAMLPPAPTAQLDAATEDHKPPAQMGDSTPPSLATSLDSRGRNLDEPTRGSYLAQAHFVNLRNGTTDFLLGADTVIDVWSTQCIRCPDALDNFSKVARATLELDIRFVALCIDSNVCDIRFFHKLDHKGIDHFYAAPDDARCISSEFGIHQVPHYLAIDESGQVRYSGKELLAAVHSFATENVRSYAESCPIWKTHHKQKEDQGLIPLDPLLTPNKNRFVLYPIQNEEIWAFYKKAEACFWTAGEIDLGADAADWLTLSDNERHFISHVLAFFAASDGIVMENLAQNFMNEVQLPEARAFYGFQIAVEQIHSETYSLLIDTLIKDPHEKTRLFNAVETLPCVQRKANWTLQWCNAANASFAERCVAFCAIEGIFFSGSFCAIFWIRTKGKMPGLCQSNNLISRDEGLHCEFASYLFRNLRSQIPTYRVLEIISSAVRIEKEFVVDALPVGLLGINAASMTNYIEFVADFHLVQLGCAKHYNTPNPFTFMEQISVDGKANFFEKVVTEYSLSTHDHVFDLDADF
jgi:ribonucleotide reductase beta subunit family protein with ferritin-like domain